MKHAADKKIEERGGKMINVLLVEENSLDMKWCRENLVNNGTARYKLNCVTQLKDTIKCLDKDKYDIVIMDLSLPDSSGFNTFISVRMHAPHVPIIVTASEGLEHAPDKKEKIHSNNPILYNEIFFINSSKIFVFIK